MKYVVLRVIDHAQSYTESNIIREVPVVFPDALIHLDMARLMARLLRQQKPDGRSRDVETVSAGFLTSLVFGADPDGCCHGESITLGVRSRPKEDSALLCNYDYLHGIVS